MSRSRTKSPKKKASAKVEKPVSPELFRLFREKSGLSQEKVGKVFDVSGVAVLQWERGEKTPRIPYRKQIEQWTGGAVPADGWVVGDKLEKEERLAERVVEPFKATGTDGGR